MQPQDDFVMRFDPADGTPKPSPDYAKPWRSYHGNLAWLYNPWSGVARDAIDVGNDVYGYLITPSFKWCTPQYMWYTGHSLPGSKDPLVEIIKGPDLDFMYSVRAVGEIGLGEIFATHQKYLRPLLSAPVYTYFQNVIYCGDSSRTQQDT